MKIYKDLEKLLAKLEPFADALNSKSSYGNTPELRLEVHTETQFEALLAEFELKDQGATRLLSSHPEVRHARGKFGAFHISITTLAPILPEHVCACCGNTHGCNGHNGEVAA